MKKTANSRELWYCVAKIWWEVWGYHVLAFTSEETRNAFIGENHAVAYVRPIPWEEIPRYLGIPVGNEHRCLAPLPWEWKYDIPGLMGAVVNADPARSGMVSLRPQPPRMWEGWKSEDNQKRSYIVAISGTMYGNGLMLVRAVEDCSLSMTLSGITDEIDAVDSRMAHIDVWPAEVAARYIGKVFPKGRNFEFAGQKTREGKLYHWAYPGWGYTCPREKAIEYCVEILDQITPDDIFAVAEKPYERTLTL